MPITFKLLQAGTFDVEFKVKHMGSCDVYLTRYDLRLLSANNTISYRQDLGRKHMDAGGKGVFAQVDGADQSPDTFFKIECLAYRGIVQAARWHWSFSITQGGQACSTVAPLTGEDAVTGLTVVRDPSEGELSFGAPFMAREILFDVIPA